GVARAIARHGERLRVRLLGRRAREQKRHRPGVDGARHRLARRAARELRRRATQVGDAPAVRALDAFALARGQLVDERAVAARQLLDETAGGELPLVFARL